MARDLAIGVAILQFFIVLTLFKAAKASEEESLSFRYLEDALQYTSEAEGNKTELEAYRNAVALEKDTSHPELANCLQKVDEELDKAVESVQSATEHRDNAQAEHIKCQAAVVAADLDKAKKAREEVKNGAEKCKKGAQDAAKALAAAHSKYFEVNKAAGYANKAAQEYRKMKSEYDLAITEGEELATMYEIAQTEASEHNDGPEFASKVRKEKDDVDIHIPTAHQGMATAELENQKAQEGGEAWDESKADSGSKGTQDACKDTEEAIKKVREACKKGRTIYYERKREQQAEMEKKLEEIMKLREELMNSINSLIEESIDDSTVQSFHDVMETLLVKIDSNLKVRMPKKSGWNEDGTQETSDDSSELSLAEFIQNIFRPIPEEWNGSIYNPTTNSCVTTLQAFRNVYYKQIEMLQRGLPTPLLRFQFSKPFAQVSSVDDQTCIPHEVVEKHFTADWFLKDTLMYGGLLEVNPLQQTNGIDFPFLSFLSVQTSELPNPSDGDMRKIDKLWDETVQAKQALGGDLSTPAHVHFSRAIDLLHDPNKTDACTDYEKFGRLNGRDTLDARQAVILLLSSALRTIAMGGSKSSVAQMLANLSAFIFNGVRCKRKEGRHIRIPAELMKAYSTNIARIIGEITNLQPDPMISSDAVEAVYATEIDAMTSFDTWGNYYFHGIYPDGHYDHSSFIEALYMNGNHISVVSLSRSLIQESRSSESVVLSNPADKSGTCGQQFKYEPNVIVDSNLMQSCCACTCDLINLMDDCYDLYLICCDRCNEYSCLATTLDEMADLPEFTVIVPEYGERHPFAVPIML